ncbi:DUF1566 domain-containing protein [Rheinheimera sp.]|uniref:Lcl C-terminal domain-containing protein n=1 Tax=Rheinheimera sp. TaxID=1869214 RepID=UPI00307D0EA8
MKSISQLVCGVLFVGLTSAQAAEVQCDHQNMAMLPSTAASNFDLARSGLVADPASALLWMRCSLGQSWDGTDCVGDATLVAQWQSALQTAENYEYQGLSGWRLPNAKELLSLVEHSCWSPALNEIVFPSAYNGDYWTSSYAAHYRESAGVNAGDGVVVDFVYGLEKVAYRASGLEQQSPSAVRLVRDLPKN